MISDMQESYRKRESDLSAGNADLTMGDAANVTTPNPTAG